MPLILILTYQAVFLWVAKGPPTALRFVLVKFPPLFKTKIGVQEIQFLLFILNFPHNNI